MAWLKSTKLVAYFNSVILAFAGLLYDKLSGAEFQLALVAITTAFVASKVGEYKYKSGA